MPVDEMDETTDPQAEADEELKPRRVRARKPVYKIRRIVEDGNDPLVAKFDTKEEVHRYVRINHPRGREVYVEHPDGYQEHYSADHEFQGHPDGGWFELTDDEVE